MHLTPDRQPHQHIIINFYRPDTLPDAQQCQSTEDASGNGDITDELKQFNAVADGEQTVLANLAMS